MVDGREGRRGGPEVRSSIGTTVARRTGRGGGVGDSTFAGDLWRGGGRGGGTRGTARSPSLEVWLELPRWWWVNSCRGGKDGASDDDSESPSDSEKPSGEQDTSALPLGVRETGGGGGGRLIPVLSGSEWANGRPLTLERGVCIGRVWAADGGGVFANMLRKDDTLGIASISSILTSGGIETIEDKLERWDGEPPDTGNSAGRRRGEALGDGVGVGFAERDGGGGGGFLLNRKSEDEVEGRRCGLPGERSPPEVARGRAVKPGAKPDPFGGGPRASCSNLDRRFFTAGGGTVSMSGGSIANNGAQQENAVLHCQTRASQRTECLPVGFPGSPKQCRP